MNLMNENKRYNTLDNYYKTIYGKKVFKISLDAGFTCPNKDGKKGYGGCSFCLSGSRDFISNEKDDLKTQFEKVKSTLLKKWPDAYYISYLQANTNTYANIDKLRKIYNECISFDKDIVMLSIATRSDEINEEIVDLLKEINQIKKVQVELGLQTSNEKTAKMINRCSSNLEFEKAVKLLDEAGIEIVIHIMNGLPYETKDDMLNTIKYLNNFPINGLKIHNLEILKNTKMLEQYEKEKFHILSLEEYKDIVCDQLEILNPNVIIHRLGADNLDESLIEPKWCLKKMVVMNEIDKEMRRRNAYQGDHFTL